MQTRIVIFLWMSAGIVGAVYAQELAAAYVAIGTAAVVWLAHVIDLKLNKLLDHYGISVPDREVFKS